MQRRIFIGVDVIDLIGMELIRACVCWEVGADRNQNSCSLVEERCWVAEWGGGLYKIRSISYTQSRPKPKLERGVYQVLSASVGREAAKVRLGGWSSARIVRWTRGCPGAPRRLVRCTY